MKRTICLLLSTLLCLPLIAATGLFAGAKYVKVTQSAQTDNSVFAPGVYDLYVFTDAVEPTYEWYVRVGKGDGASNYMPLEDNDKYSGVYTNHLSLITNDGMEYTDDESGWDGLYFSCLVTDKDGSHNYGPDMNMIVFTHQSLLNKLEENHVGFDRFGVSNAAASREIDGVKYYDCYAENGIDFFYGATEIPEGTFKRSFLSSECELKTELVITEGKKSHTLLEPVSYQPKRTGMGAVQVTANLVLYMNGERMETIDTVSCVVNVMINGVGAAYTKSATFLKETASYSGTVIKSLAKDTYVRLIESKGSYWKVAADGYIGYVSTSALAIMDDICAVSLSIPEPASYQTYSTAVTLADPDLYYMNPQRNQEIWYDKTTGHFMKPGELFYPTRQYRLTIELTAQEGKRFQQENNAPKVLALINGVSATCRVAYEQDPEEVVELTIDFNHVHDLQKVNRVYPTCTTAGKQLYYRCSGCGWGFTDAQASEHILDEDWGVIPALGHRESEWKTDGQNHYKICQRRECGEVILYGAHEWSQDYDYRDKDGHAHLCAVCGMHDTLNMHRPGPAASENMPQLCLDCGYILSGGGLIGDVDANGVIDLADVMTLAKQIAGWNLGDEYHAENADCDGNGIIDIGDVTILAKFIAGWGVSLG